MAASYATTSPTAVPLPHGGILQAPPFEGYFKVLCPEAKAMSEPWPDEILKERDSTIAEAATGAALVIVPSLVVQLLPARRLPELPYRWRASLTLP